MMLEELAPGMVFHGGPVAVSAEEVIACARLHDPRPFHTAAIAAAAHPVFQGHFGRGAVGGGELSRTRPVRPGDTPRLETEGLEVTRSRPDRGTAVMRSRTVNPRDGEVRVFAARLVVPRRTHGAA